MLVDVKLVKGAIYNIIMMFPAKEFRNQLIVEASIKNVLMENVNLLTFARMLNAQQESIAIMEFVFK